MGAVADALVDLEVAGGGSGRGLLGRGELFREDQTEGRPNLVREGDTAEAEADAGRFG